MYMDQGLGRAVLVGSAGGLVERLAQRDGLFGAVIVGRFFVTHHDRMNGMGGFGRMRMRRRRGRDPK